MPVSGAGQFYRLARYYDALNTRKDYPSEATRLDALARRLGRSGGTTWLDVACGTGRHLEALRKRHAVCGVDASPDMLRIARRRLPGVPLVLGDMRSFRLDASFDVVTCLFSAIGHLRSERDLLKAFSNFARHLKPGGIAVVEPWLDPTKFLPSSVHLVTYQGPRLTVVRLARSARRGRHSVIRYHFLVSERGRRIRHVEVVDVGLLVPRERLLRLMREAGLRARFLARGLTPGRGLLVGLKPHPPGDRSRVRRSMRSSRSLESSLGGGSPRT